ncbi:MAG: hypothetical protein OZ922_03890 [Myxococcales bacterium]|jgi:hypothetical protein|nr:hypothetical protein [Myxococcales bacterium]
MSDVPQKLGDRDPPPAPARLPRIVDDPREQAWLESMVRNNRYVAFIDVLGYSALLSDHALTPETVRAQYLYDVWQVMVYAFDRMLLESPNVDAILFSDAAYLSATELHPVAAAVGILYMELYSWFRGHPETWLPWLRCAIGHGWIMTVNNPTSARLAREMASAGSERGAEVRRRGVFRNPAGPGLYDAYRLAELKEAPGMRILTARSTFEGLKSPATAPLGPRAASVLADMIRPPDPRVAVETSAGAVVDLPWWRAVDDAATRIAVWREHEWQRGYGNISRAWEHYDATLALVGDA